MSQVYDFIVIGLLVISSLILLVITILEIRGPRANREELERLEQEVTQLASDNAMMSSQYSDNVLKFVQTFTTQLTSLYFREFVDNHEIDKVNKSQLEMLIQEISTKVHDSIRIDFIKFDWTLFTKEFVETYIVQTVVNSVKALWDGLVNGETQ